MDQELRLNSSSISLRAVEAYVFDRGGSREIHLDEEVYARVEKSHDQFNTLFESGIPIYGVTTGFGDSCTRTIDREQSKDLQNNLVSYLLCGTGPMLPESVCKATSLVRFISLCKGFSGVSTELINRMKTFLENGWYPVIPAQGSLGASGDLIPLAYLANVLRGEGEVYVDGDIRSTSSVLEEANLKAYEFKPKEGLAIVNGTATMAGHAVVNINSARYLLDLSIIATSWLCLSLDGKTEAFGPLVNERANIHQGQGEVAHSIRTLLADEDYRPTPAREIKSINRTTEGFVQDKYSLRCTPQILGPVLDTIRLAETWVESEINGVSDNPVVDVEGDFAMGGNFYGGYLAHSMDYLKISLAQVADLVDRQLTYLADDKSNRGLAPNLANWSGLSEAERNLHHGLKGIHQAVSAITSDIMAQSIPNSIFSRSSESHNQDKVSLGMTAAVRCSSLIDSLYNVLALYLVAGTQALDLKKIELKGVESKKIYDIVRKRISFVDKDQSLDTQISALVEDLKLQSEKNGGLFAKNLT